MKLKKPRVFEGMLIIDDMDVCFGHKKIATHQSESRYSLGPPLVAETAGTEISSRA